MKYIILISFCILVLLSCTRSVKYFTSQDMKKFSKGSVKEGDQFNEMELKALATLYKEVILNDFLEGDWQGLKKRLKVMYVSLQTSNKENIDPPKYFFKLTPKRSFKLEPMSNRDHRDHLLVYCELGLYRWISPDSAFCAVTLMSGISGYGKQALAVRINDKWEIVRDYGTVIIN